MRYGSSSANAQSSIKSACMFFTKLSVMGQCPTQAGRPSGDRWASKLGTYPVKEDALGPLWPEQTFDKGTEIMA